ncbi:MAG: sigma 54-interacting transcriptional regulator [Cellvibrionales bacterium]|nr:sigma 54-interacting transcriptional regulator [Cellvibrionales bacterium]
MWRIIGRDKPKILIVGYRKFSQLMSVVHPEFAGQAHFEIADHILTQDSSVDELVEGKDADLVISAGANASYLQSLLSVPTLGIAVTEGDILDALHKAAKIGKKILLITYQKEYRVLDFIRQYFTAELIHKTYSTPNEARELLYLHIPENIDVVIGSSHVCDLAEQQNLKSLLVYSRSSCRELIEAAIAKGEETIEQKLNHAIDNSVLEGAGPPVLVANFAGDLLRYNQTAMAKLGAADEADALRLAQLIQTGTGRGGKQFHVELNGTPRFFTRQLLNIKGKKRAYLYSMRTGEAKTSAAKGQTPTDHQMVYASEKMAQIHRILPTYAATAGTVLITGETGTGKELIARELHRSGPFKGGQFIAINCGAVPEELFESELFGYVDGAFTTSKRGGRTGLLEAANNGVFFLDEISELPLTQQAKLLRTMQDRRIRPLGTNKEISLHLKFVCASNQNLLDAVKAGTFREDLFYRVNVFTIDLPALRERPADIPAIANYFAEKIKQRYRLEVDIAEIFSLCGKQLRSYAWPGNVRQLENAVERLLVSRPIFTDPEQFVHALPSLLPEWSAERSKKSDPPTPSAAAPAGTLKEQEWSLIMDAMKKFGGDKAKVSGYLGISQTTLWRRLKSPP